MSRLLSAYASITNAGTPVLEWLLKRRLQKGKEDPVRLDERRGLASLPRPQEAGLRLLWVHAASVGESQAALILIESLKAYNIRILVTTGTVTSASLMERRLPDYAFHQYIPVDHPLWVERFLNHWKPDLAFWMESELWPNMLLALKKRGTPAVLLNARMSNTSFNRWRYAPKAARAILESFVQIQAQTENDAARFRLFGHRNVSASGNIKFSAAPLPYDEIAFSAMQLATEDRAIWVYASTHAGEEALACRVHKKLREEFPSLLTVIVPRHPQRTEEIAAACFENGVTYTLRSQNGALPAPDDDIYIADTLGELGLFYRLAPIAMIGRSFSNDGGGGHNPIEAAQYHCAVLTGPHNQYQRPIYNDMQAADAVKTVHTESELAEELGGLLRDPGRLRKAQENAAYFAQQKKHVIDAVMEKLEPVLTPAKDSDAA